MSHPPPPTSGWRWGVPALLLIAALALPLGALVVRAVAPSGVISTTAVEAVLGDPNTWSRMAFSTGLALATAAIAILLGLPAAYVLSQFRFAGRRLVLALITVPIVLPSMVLVLALEQLLGAGGWVNDALRAIGAAPVEIIGTVSAVLLAHAAFGVAIVVRLVGGTWALLDQRQCEAARVLGASGWRAFRHVSLPALGPAIESAATLVFLFAFMSFATVSLLGDPRTETFEVGLYRLSDWTTPEAAVLSLLQLLITVPTVLVYTSMRREFARPTPARMERPRSLAQASGRERGLVLVVVATLLVLVVLPLAALVAGAAMQDGLLTTERFIALSTDTEVLEAIRWSLMFAAGASLIALVFGGLAGVAVARSRGRGAGMLETLLSLPLAVPPIALGVGILIATEDPARGLVGSPILVLSAHALLAYTFVMRPVVTAGRAMNPGLSEAAAVLGADPARAWRSVDRPILVRAFVVGAVLAFLVSLGEIGATLLLAAPEHVTVPVLLSAPGAADADRSLALGSILMGITVVAFVLIERFRYRDVSEF